jgi:hypothetical protein
VGYILQNRIVVGWSEAKHSYSLPGSELENAMITSPSKTYLLIPMIVVAVSVLASSASVAQKKRAGMSAAQIQQMMQSGQVPPQYMQYVPQQYQQGMNGGGVSGPVDFQSGFNNSGNPYQTSSGVSPSLPPGLR